MPLNCMRARCLPTALSKRSGRIPLRVCFSPVVESTAGPNHAFECLPNQKLSKRRVWQWNRIVVRRRLASQEAIQEMIWRHVGSNSRCELRLSPGRHGPLNTLGGTGHIMQLVRMYNNTKMQRLCRLVTPFACFLKFSGDAA